MNFVHFKILCSSQIVIMKISFWLTNFLNFTPHTFQNAASTPMIHPPQHCEVHFCGLYNYPTSGKIIAADLELWSRVQVETNVNTSIQKP
jgi:hypothetical protein